MLVEKNLRRIDRPGHQRIDGDDLTLPLGIEQIPVGANLRGIDQLRIKSDIARPRRAFEDEDITVLRIIVMMLALEPIGFVKNLGQHQQRLDRLEDLGFMKHRQRRDVAGDAQVGDILLAAPLAHHPLAQLKAAADY